MFCKKRTKQGPVISMCVPLFDFEGQVLLVTRLDNKVYLITKHDPVLSMCASLWGEALLVTRSAKQT